MEIAANAPRDSRLRLLMWDFLSFYVKQARDEVRLLLGGRINSERSGWLCHLDGPPESLWQSEDFKAKVATVVKMTNRMHVIAMPKGRDAAAPGDSDGNADKDYNQSEQAAAATRDDKKKGCASPQFRLNFISILSQFQSGL
eukprot:814264-Prorocentrum_minimum.AAC.4